MIPVQLSTWFGDSFGNGVTKLRMVSEFVTEQFYTLKLTFCCTLHV